MFRAVGLLLQQQRVVDVEPAVFASVREQVVQDLTVDIALHPDLAAIMTEVVARLGLAPLLVDRLVEAELTVECDVCRAVPGAVDRLERARVRTSHGVVFISDTPVPEDFLRELLAREGLLKPGDRLYTSARWRASKQHGGLFDVVTSDLGTAPAEMTHVGDDRWADYVHPRQRGWHATLDRDGALNAREQSLDRADLTTDGLGPRLAAAARTARLEAQTQGLDRVVASVAGAVAAPLLVGFGLWVLQQAQQQKLDRLYFVSRDGQVYLEVTQRLAEHLGVPVECRYLYGSRRAWQLAANGVAGHDPVAGLWVPDGATLAELTPRQLLALVDLDLDTARELVPGPLLSDGRADEPLGDVDGSQLWAKLSDGPVVDEITRRARDRHDLLVRYLDAEGVTGPGRVGLVDVGWSGRAAKALEDVILDAGRPLPVAQLFFGLQGSAPEQMGPDLFGRSQGWFLDEARGRLAPTGSEDPVMLAEMFAMGSEGHTLGYRLVGDVVEPHLAHVVNPSSLRWAFADYRAGLALALDALIEGGQLRTEADLRPLAWQQLLAFWRRPTPAEARAWGAQPYGEDFDNLGVSRLAAPIGVRRLLTRTGVGPQHWRLPTYWLPGSIVISPQPWRSALDGLQQTRERAARLARVPRRLRAEWMLRRA